MGSLFGLESYDLLFYLGMAVMSIAVSFAILFLVVFKISGKRLKIKLDKEYGEPELYNRGKGKK